MYGIFVIPEEGEGVNRWVRGLFVSNLSLEMEQALLMLARKLE